MHLTQTAEYALRTMAQLAIAESGEYVPAKDLATLTEIPSHYLSKLLRKLVVSGLLRSEKGHGGGFCLAKPPHRIRIIDVLQAVDAGPVPDRCGFGWGKCNPQKPCPLHPIWSQLSEAYEDWARRRTLSDLRRSWLGYGHGSRRAPQT